MEGHSTTGYFLDYRLLAMPLDSWHQQQREISINISLKNKKPWKVYVQMLFYQMWNLEVNFYCILYCLILFIIIFALLCSTWWFCGIEILKISDNYFCFSFFLVECSVLARLLTGLLIFIRGRRRSVWRQSWRVYQKRYWGLRFQMNFIFYSSDPYSIIIVIIT